MSILKKAGLTAIPTTLALAAGIYLTSTSAPEAEDVAAPEAPEATETVTVEEDRCTILFNDFAETLTAYKNIDEPTSDQAFETIEELNTTIEEMGYIPGHLDKPGTSESCVLPSAHATATEELEDYNLHDRSQIFTQIATTETGAQLSEIMGALTERGEILRQEEAYRAEAAAAEAAAAEQATPETDATNAIEGFSLDN